MGLARKLPKAAYSLVPFKQPLFTLLRHVPLPTPLIRHLRFRGVITVCPVPRRCFRMHNHATYVENDLFWFGYGRGWEGVSLRVWSRLAAQAHAILDVGANTGTYSLAARCVNPAARIVAFEPSAKVYDILRANIALNDYDVVAEKLAVSDRRGAATLYDTADEFSYVGSLEPVAAPAAGLPACVDEQPVDCVRLDDYLAAAAIQHVDLVKLDIEGHEPAALRGFAATLARDRPVLLIEILSDAVAEHVERLSTGFGYRMFSVLEDRGLVETSRAGAEGEHRNFLFCTQHAFVAARLDELVIG